MTIMFKLLNGPFYINITCEEVLLGKVLIQMNSFWGDVSNLVATIANYAYEFLFSKQTPHLEGEEVFGYAKHNVDFSPRGQVT